MSNVGGIGSTHTNTAIDAQSTTPHAPDAAHTTAAAAIVFGARGDDVRSLQSNLNKLGYPAGTADGIFGRGTQTAVATFQRAAGLTPSGNADAATLVAIDAKLKSSTGGTSQPAANVDRSLVFIGMGDGAKLEASGFAGRTATTAITDSAKDDQVTLSVGGRTKTYDLTKRENCDAYAKDIGLTGAKATEVGKIIYDAGSDARDETAGVARVFAEAQGGKREIERLVISGHSYGEGVWGDNNGYFELSTLSKLATAFPKAAGQVEDFMYAGCYSGGESNMNKFQQIFPNLKTAWAYTHAAPGAASGATVHEARWEAATRGHDASKVKFDVAKGTRFGENVGTWNKVTGYQNADTVAKPLAELRADYNTKKAGFGDYFSGAKAVTNTQAGPVREYYNSIQALLQSPNLPTAERPNLEAARDQVIRLNFFDNWKGKFQTANQPAIQAGFIAVGLPVPDFSTLSRKDALAQVAAFERKLSGASVKPPSANALLPLLTEGLRDMKASRVPAAWV